MLEGKERVAPIVLAEGRASIQEDGVGSVGGW